LSQALLEKYFIPETTGLGRIGAVNVIDLNIVPGENAGDLSLAEVIFQKLNDRVVRSGFVCS
jgi:hypothetical protein